MKLEDYPDISERRKKEILSWPDSHLRIEIEKGRNSRFPKSIPFMKAVLAERESEQQSVKEQARAEHAEAMLQEAIEANRKSGTANKIAAVAVLISIVALLVAWFRNG